MFSLRKRKKKSLYQPEGAALWSDILEALRADRPYNDRLETILSTLDKVVDFDVYHIYLLNREGKRFSLEYTKVKVLENESRLENKKILDLNGVGEFKDRHSTHQSPLIDFPYNAHHNEAHVTTTQEGFLYTVPLQREGRLVGLMQMGPLTGKNVSPAIEQTVTHLVQPISFAVAQAGQEEELRQQLRFHNIRSGVGRRLLNSAFELGEFIDLLLDLALTATGTESGFVAITEPDGDKLVIQGAKNMPDEFLKRVNLVIGEGIFDWMSEEMHSLIVRDLEFAQEMGIKSILAVPLVEEDLLLGIFALVNFQKSETFDDHNLKLLTHFVDQIRLVLNKVRLLDQFSQHYLEILKALNKVMDMHDSTTISHTERVTAVSVRIAEKMNISAHEVDIIRTAAEIHDVGLCGIAEASQGFHADYNHPTIGADLIRILSLPSNVAETVESHHEWFDGGGYPKGLKGEEIILGGRILALAEYFVEVTTVNEIQPPMSWNKLKNEIKMRRGTQFDPEVANVLLDIMEEKRAMAGDRVLDGCIVFKGCPTDLQDACPAKTDSGYCFRYRESGVQCSGHGDRICDTCFLYVEWQERMGREK